MCAVAFSSCILLKLNFKSVVKVVTNDDEILQSGLAQCVSLSVRLSASSPDPGRSVSAKFKVCKTLKTCPVCTSLLDTLRKCLKSCILSWQYGHAY